MINMSCLFLTGVLAFHIPFGMAHDHCYALLKIRFDQNYQQAHFNGMALNPDTDLVGSLTRAEIPFHEFFSKLTHICDNLCKAREDGCTGYLIGNFIEANELRDAATALRKIYPEYNKDDDGIKNTTKEPDCICLKPAETTPKLRRQYNDLVSTFTDGAQIFSILSQVVAFWKILYNYLILDCTAVEDRTLEETLSLRRAMFLQ